MYKGYSFLGLIELTLFAIITRIFFPKCRMVRFPIFIRNKRLISFGDGLSTGRYCRLEAFNIEGNTCLYFGKNCQINDFVHIAAKDKIFIGNNVLIASRVFITDHNHGNYSGDNQSDSSSIVVNRPLSTAPVYIDDNVWIGEGAAILPGVTIGANSIVGTNAVVTKDIPPNTIAVGAPASAIKKYDTAKKKWLLIDSRAAKA